MTGSISPEDRALIERTRKVNKTLSVYVFAVQERSNIPADSQIGIADMLVALADTIRERTSQQADDNALSIAAPALPRSAGPTIHLAATPERQGVAGKSEFNQ